MTRRLLALLLAALATLLAHPALAETATTPSWRADVSPLSGTDEDYLTLHTTGGCPTGATNVIGRVYGKGLRTDGEVVVGSTSAGVSPYSSMSLPLGVTMREVVFEQDALFRLAGHYRFVLSCFTRSSAGSQAKIVGQYVASIDFVTPTTWRADGPLTTRPGPVEQRADGAGPPGSQPSAPSGSGASGQSASGASPGAARPSETSSAAGKTTSPSSAAGSSSTGTWVPVVLGLVVLVASALLLRPARRRRQTPVTGEPR